MRNLRHRYLPARVRGEALRARWPVRAAVKFHLSETYVSYWYDAGTPASAVGKLPSHIANNHLIPANEEVADVLNRIAVGDLVVLRGKLVDVDIHDADG